MNEVNETHAQEDGKEMLKRNNRFDSEVRERSIITFENPLNQPSSESEDKNDHRVSVKLKFFGNNDEKDLEVGNESFPPPTNPREQANDQSVAVQGKSEIEAHNTEKVESLEEGYDSPLLSSSTKKPTRYPVTSATGMQDWSCTLRLGFPLSNKPYIQEAEQEAYRSYLRTQEEKREQQWQSMCKGIPLLASCSLTHIAQLRAAAEKYGVSTQLRPVLWLTLTGVAAKIDENEYYCRAVLLKQGYVVHSLYTKSIEIDLERTFPGHPYFSDSDVGIYKLRNILHVQYWRYPLISYCQSFNYLTAFLLLLFDDEERVFWMLCYILEELLPNDYYDENLVGTKVDQLVFEELVRERLPQLFHFCENIGFDLKTLIPNWFMSLYINALPIQTVLRVWDYILVERSPNYSGSGGAGAAAAYTSRKTTAHLEIGLGLLKMAEKTILASEDSGAAHVAISRFTSTCYDSEKLLTTARSSGIAISPEDLHQRRRRVKPLVLQEVYEREVRRAAFKEKQRAELCRSPPPLPPPSNSTDNVSHQAMDEDDLLEEYRVGQHLDCYYQEGETPIVVELENGVLQCVPRRGSLHLATTAPHITNTETAGVNVTSNASGRLTDNNRLNLNMDSKEFGENAIEMKYLHKSPLS